MKIKVYIPKWNADKKHLRICVGETIVFNVHEGESGYNTLSHNFGACWGIPGLLKAAFEAGQSEGKDGTFIIERTEEDPE